MSLAIEKTYSMVLQEISELTDGADPEQHITHFMSSRLKIWKIIPSNKFRFWAQTMIQHLGLQKAAAKNEDEEQEARWSV